MQVPASITLTNGLSSSHNNHNNYTGQRSAYFENTTFAMDVPEKLTG